MARKAIQTKQLVGWLTILTICVAVCGCHSRVSNATTDKASRNTVAGAKVKFRPYEAVDEKQGGLVVSRLAVPQDWKATSRVLWNYNDFYLPVHVSARAEAPDGGSWIEFFPAEFFVWLDPAHDGMTRGHSLGGIHHPNVTLPVALVQYVIARNRAHTQHLRVLGYRPVNDLPKAFPHVFTGNPPKGEGICMRVQYELNGAPVDEEFYAFMGELIRIPAQGMVEFHRQMFMVHSMGAKSGKLESARPLLGFIATSIDPNPAWQKRVAEVQKMQMNYYNQSMANSYAGIRAAGERSRAISAQNDQFLHNIDAGLAQNRAQQSASSSSSSSSSNEDFYKRADSFDQTIRGTEHMQDQYGVVSDQYTDYNYHWTDGYGRFVHTDDPNLDPNKYLNGNYQQMTPAQ